MSASLHHPDHRARHAHDGEHHHAHDRAYHREPASLDWHPELAACEQCDLLLERAALGSGDRAHCTRCGALLGRAAPVSFEFTLAFALAGLVMLVIAHMNAIVGIEIQGRVQSASLWAAAMTLYDDGAWQMSVLVVLTTLVFPAMELLAICYLLLPLRDGHVPPGFAQVLRVMQSVRPWVMVEVFMLGVLVAVVKLAGIAAIVPGAGLWSFSALMLLLAAAAGSFDHHSLWHALPPPDAGPGWRRRAARG
jgi:paraquat-inducible protein A